MPGRSGASPPGALPTRGGGQARLGGAGERLARDLEPRIEHEIRATVLGHLQRGGSPVSFDRILATRFGCRAAQLAAERRTGEMVCLQRGDVGAVPLGDAIDRTKRVDPDGQLVAAARAMGVGFGDEA